MTLQQEIQGCFTAFKMTAVAVWIIWLRLAEEQQIPPLRYGMTTKGQCNRNRNNNDREMDPSPSTRSGSG
jgi:hypothetical protein